VKYNGCKLLILGMIFWMVPVLPGGCQEPGSQMPSWRTVARTTDDGEITSTGNKHQQNRRNKAVFTPRANSVDFTKVGLVEPTPRVRRLARKEKSWGVYRVVPGDVLELEMPSILRNLSADLTDSMQRVKPYRCRVRPDGGIILPIAGKLSVGGKSMAEIEIAVTDLYYPKYILNPPSVVGKVIQHKTVKISVIGAVFKPGVYDCRSDQMSLVALIHLAGGITEGGASEIRVHRRGEPKPIKIPVKGVNIPFTEVPLQDGDYVEVEALSPQMFTVIGLVKRSGGYPYPPGAQYNLMQALAFAGGVNEIADPRWVTVFRKDTDEQIVSRKFAIKGTGLTEASGVLIRPGDVITVEQTFRTRFNLFITEIFRVTTGFNLEYRIDENRND